jgi:hypothetical protein
MKKINYSKIIAAARTLSIAIITMLIFAYANSYAQAGWTGAPENPPEENAPAPLNVSDEDQEKTGPLIVNSGLVSQIGLAVFGDAEFDGGILAQGDICTTVNGDEICLGSMVAPVESSFQCSAPVFNSMLYRGETDPDCSATADACTPKSSRVVGYQSIEIPSSCSTPEGCVIRYQLYNSKNVLDITRYTRFIQETDAQANGGRKWWSEYNKKGSAVNGDGTTSNVIPPMRRTLSTGAVQWLLVRDDRASMTNIGENARTNYTETSSSRLSAYDTRTDRGMAVSFCYDTEVTSDIGE